MKLGNAEILYINALANVCGVNAKACIIDEDAIIFIVKGSDVGKAIGKQGANISALGKKLGKRVEIFGFGENAANFIMMAFPKISFAGFEEVQAENSKKVLFMMLDQENKRALLENSGKLKRIKEVARKAYNVDEVIIKSAEHF